MIQVTLYGTSSCRRYQRMRELVVREAERLGVPIQLDEIGDTKQLSQINPLSLPSLYIDRELIASQNPPKAQIIEAALERVLPH